MLKGYPDVMDIDQMAHLLGISKKQVISFCKTERLFMKIGRCYPIPKVHLLAYLKNGAEA